MKISPSRTTTSIAIAAVGLINIFRSSPTPCWLVAGFDDLAVNEFKNPLTEAVLAVNKESYKLVQLETLNYDHDVSGRITLPLPSSAF
jgi:hypothetical protein